jgi:seryl-tRNA synthetase
MELALTHELHEKRRQKKEEMRRAGELLREEEKFQKDIEKAKADERNYERLLEKAKQEADRSTGEELDSLKKQIEELSAELEKAHAKSERALSMAQQTKAEHIYIISNIGSFGEDVFKIGMTRRLDPYDRVKELGDSSVPFHFDLHALIYSEDAPSLEK